MIRLLLVVMLLLIPSTLHSKLLAEMQIVCDSKLEARFDDAGLPVLLAQCVTYDALGVIVRPPREYDVTARLTTQERNGLASILTRLQRFAEDTEAIPTPTVSPTPTPTRTATSTAPTPTPTRSATPSPTATPQSPTPVATPSNVCGNGLIEAGENCELPNLGCGALQSCTDSCTRCAIL